MMESTLGFEMVDPIYIEFKVDEGLSLKSSSRASGTTNYSSLFSTISKLIKQGFKY